MTDTINLPLTAHAITLADTAPMDDMVIVVGSSAEAIDNYRMLGAWSASGWGLAWFEGTEHEAFEAPVLNSLFPRGLVLQDIRFSEESIISRWLPFPKEKKSYNIRAFVTGGTVDVRPVSAGSRPAFGNFYCRSIFQRPGLVDITLPMRTQQLFFVQTELRSQSLLDSSVFEDVEFGEHGSEANISSAATSINFDPAQTKLEKQVLNVVSAASGGRFEDGVESSFSRDLRSIVEKEGKSAVIVLTKTLATADANVVAETLRTLARSEDSTSYDERRWLLEANLTAKSPLVRDVAVSGLALLADRRSIPALRRAVSQERISALRADMEEILRELEREERTKAS